MTLIELKSEQAGGVTAEAEHKGNRRSKIMSNSQQLLGVAAENKVAVGIGDAHRFQTLQHLGNAADLVWIVASRKNLAGAGEAHGQLKRTRIEVDGIKIKFFQIRTWNARNIFAAVGKRFIAAIKPFGQIRNSATQVPQHPFNIRKTLSYASKDQAGCRKRCIHKKTHERHKPVVQHGFYAYGICGMNMDHRAEFICGFPQWPETLVTKRNAVDVAENHHARKFELLHGAAQLNH